MAETELHKVYIGIGSNVGDRAGNCRRAVWALGETGDCRLVAQSPLYETEPMYVEDQDWFINSVVSVETALAPEALLDRLHEIEKSMGRSEGPRFGPRCLDLDILFYDDRVLNANGLEIPHPRVHERRFMLQPLCDISPDLIHPVLGRTVRFLLLSLQGDAKKVLNYK